jgi:acyl carrier protein
MEKFLNKLAEILEVEKVNLDNVLVDFEEWDSLTSLSIIATIDSYYNVNISAEELLSCRTVNDLLQMIQKKTIKS